MGCRVVKAEDDIELKGTSQLRVGFEVNLKEMSEQALALGVLAIFADDFIKVTRIEHKRNQSRNY